MIAAATASAPSTEHHESSIKVSRALANRASAFQPSVWQAIDEVIERHPDAIYFGSGSPARELMPLDRLAQAAAIVWASAGDALGYGEVHGYLPLRELISRRMAAQGMAAASDQIVVTNGSQQGLDLIAKLFLDPDDLVVVEGPTYPGAMQLFDAYEARYVTVPVDEDGLNVAALATTLDRLDRAPKLIYTIPTFQNPSGVTMSRQRREGLIALAHERAILIVEDDPYGEIFFNAPPEPALRALDPGVVYLGTFSKTIAPAIRVGWMAAPDDLVDMLVMAKEAIDIHSDRIIMRTVYHAADGFLDDHVERTRGIYGRRRDALLAGLAEHMPTGVRWSRPDGGFFVWVTLPGGLDAEAFLPFAAERGVAFLPGAWFYPHREERNALRLSYSTLGEDAIAEGARRLGLAVREFMAR